MVLTFRDSQHAAYACIFNLKSKKSPRAQNLNLDYKMVTLEAAVPDLLVI